MMTESTEQERAEFIKWAIDALEANTEQCLLFENEFADPLTNAAWFAWQASRRAQVVPEGWKLVPIEPTLEMLDAYVAADGRFHSGRTDWAVMLAAAPSRQRDSLQPNHQRYHQRCHLWRRNNLVPCLKPLETIKCRSLCLPLNSLFKTFLGLF